ncbi:hypothetical protein [Pontibacter rugosus]|uniref:Uncharacterized protein n=1 Tax=Pontibacter rugosus TaxID=1745966 RepID=A0ABW3SKM0_9BACT
MAGDTGRKRLYLTGLYDQLLSNLFPVPGLSAYASFSVPRDALIEGLTPGLGAPKPKVKGIVFAN